MNARAARDLSRIVATENKSQRMTNDWAFGFLIAIVAAGLVVVSFMVAGGDVVSVIDPGYFFED